VTPQEIEQHRLVCEARYVLAMPKEARKPWLDSIGKRRGPEAQKYLEVEVIRQHKLIKERACG
jgi:hypothetical protein